MNYDRRIAELRRRIAAEGVDAFIATPDANWQYLTGISRLGGGNSRTRQHGIEYACLVVTPRDVVAFMPELNLLGRESKLPEARLVGLPEGDLSGTAIRGELRRLGLAGKRVGVSQDLSAAMVFLLQKDLSADALDMDRVVVDMRAVKDADELNLIRKSVEITDRIYEALRDDVVKPGVPVRQVERAIDRLLEEYGASKSSFPGDANTQGPLAGPMIGLSHHSMEKGYVVGLDFGVMYQGYCSDFGRTFFIGEPTKRHMEIYELVYEAHMAGCAELKAGMSCGEAADEAARGVFRRAGYEKEFIHKLGHSIGLDVHERPFLAKGEKERFQAGEIFAVEPSLYFPRDSFIRLEDEVLVTTTGFEILSKAPHAPVIIE